MGDLIILDIKKGLREDLDNCPLCHALPPWAEFLDGDTVLGNSLIHEGAANFHYVRDSFAFNPMLFAHECTACGETVHTVEVDLIANKTTCEAWEDKYFNRNEDIQEQETPYTVTLLKPNQPPFSWLLTRTETPEGLLDRHFLPLASTQKTKQKKSLASCSGELIWQQAAHLVNQFWHDMSLLNFCALPCRYEYDLGFEDDIPF
jgi:hypothetical protein